MKSIPGLSEQMIRRHAAGETFSRGKSYAREGMVASLTLRDGVLEALVHGSQYEPYRVRVTFDAGGVAAATCTCPYGTGAWCKHIVAALLVALRQTETVQVAPPLEARSWTRTRSGMRMKSWTRMRSGMRRGMRSR